MMNLKLGQPPIRLSDFFSVRPYPRSNFVGETKRIASSNQSRVLESGSLREPICCLVEIVIHRSLQTTEKDKFLPISYVRRNIGRKANFGVKFEGETEPAVLCVTTSSRTIPVSNKQQGAEATMLIFAVACSILRNYEFIRQKLLQQQ